MTKITAKIAYSPLEGGDVPVWESIGPDGKRKLYARKNINGLIPKGFLSKHKIGESTLIVLDSVVLEPGEIILTEKNKDKPWADEDFYNQED